MYIPGSYSTYTNPQDPVGVQQMISTAISSTSGQYLSYNGEAIDAEFGSDMQDRTQTEHLNPGDPPVDPFVPKAYLTGVEDPISTASCFNNSSGGHDYGMSQRGAIRWSLGNECPTGTGAVWPITWTDYRQILVHYYTGIDILDGNDNHVAPDDRWNLLWHLPRSKFDCKTLRPLHGMPTTWKLAIIGAITIGKLPVSANFFPTSRQERNFQILRHSPLLFLILLRLLMVEHIPCIWICVVAAVLGFRQQAGPTRQLIFMSTGRQPHRLSRPNLLRFPQKQIILNLLKTLKKPFNLIC